jgi:hypothetical protein
MKDRYRQCYGTPLRSLPDKAICHTHSSLSNRRKDSRGLQICPVRGGFADGEYQKELMFKYPVFIDITLRGYISWYQWVSIPGIAE